MATGPPGLPSKDRAFKRSIGSSPGARLAPRSNSGRTSFQSMGMRSASMSRVAQACRIFWRMAATGRGSAPASEMGSEIVGRAAGF